MSSERNKLLPGDTPLTGEVLKDLRKRLGKAFGYGTLDFFLTYDFSGALDYKRSIHPFSPNDEYAIPLDESWIDGQRKITTFSDGSWQLEYKVKALHQDITVSRRPDGIINLEGTFSGAGFCVLLEHIQKRGEVSPRTLITSPNDLLSKFRTRFPALLEAPTVSCNLETDRDGKIILKGAYIKDLLT